MIFDYLITKNNTQFKYIAETKEELSGMGEVTILKLNDYKGNVFFDYPVKNPHNDIMAFIIIVIFYPFIKKSITFEFNISKFFIENLKKIRKFKNVEIVSSKIINIPEYDGNEISICVGGGLDSSAIMCLFKDTYLFHATNKEKVDVDKLAKACGCKKNVDKVNSNIKEFIKPQMFTHWISVFIGVYLFAQDQKVRYIFLGTQLDSNNIILNNKFNPQGLKKGEYNYRDLSKDLGIEMINIFNGCTNILISKIIYQNKLDKYARFCDRGVNGQSCKKCAKCFRKILCLSYHNKEYEITDNNDYEAYKFVNHSNYKHLYLYKSPEFYKCSELRKFKKKHNDIDASWLDKIYPRAYEEYDIDMRNKILSKISEYGNIMNDYNIRALETFEIPMTNVIEKYTNNSSCNNCSNYNLVIFTMILILVIAFVVVFSIILL